MEINLRKQDACVIEEMGWGHLEWYASGGIGNSESTTVGMCVIDVGQANGRHLHPNCSEILLVLEGEIIHSLEDEKFAMTVGDVIVIPRGVVHNARNVGDGPARLSIVFDTGYRETQGVED
jgi:quercetin dioxygenase-like cupin family protein